MPGNPPAVGSPAAAIAASRRRSYGPNPSIRSPPGNSNAGVVDPAAALEVGGEALEDRGRSEVDVQAAEVEAAGLARGVQQRRRVVHPASLEQDRLAQPPDEPRRVGLVGHGRDRQPGRMGRRRRAPHEHARVGGHPARGRGVDRLERQYGRVGALDLPPQAHDHEGERQPVAEFDLQATELRLRRP